MSVCCVRARCFDWSEQPKRQTALAAVSAIPCGTDESITLRMLGAAARIRYGEFDQGLRELLAARADAAGAHPTIRSEIA